MGVITDANGLYYMRARYYNPDIKRFVNADILAGSITDGRTLNRYAYVNGNPISFVDPFGLSAEETEENDGWLHGVLDVVGFVPIIGVVADGINSALYLAEGNFVMAGVSIACAVGADTIFKSAKYAVKAAGEVTQIGVAAVKQVTEAGVKSVTDIVSSAVGKRFSKNVASEVAERASKEAGKNKLTKKFYKSNGGINKEDFMTIHSEKHLYNPNQVSSKNKTQSGKDIDVAKLREDTMLYPDKIIYNDEQNVIKYVKEYDFNISTPDTPTGSHRVFINLGHKPGKTNRNSQFPFYKGGK